jgi:hypothetical protein
LRALFTTQIIPIPILEAFFMAPISIAERSVEPARPAPATHPNRTEPNAPSDARPVPAGRRTLRRNASDDEILGLGNGVGDSTNPAIANQLVFDFDASADARSASNDSNVHRNSDASAEPENFRATLDANPELRRDLEDAKSYREVFSTPEDARAATALLADLNRMDSLFFSHRPEDHAELARSIASLDPAAFASLAHAMASVGAQSNSAPNPATSSTLSSRRRAALWPDEGSVVGVRANGDEYHQIPRTASRAAENRGNVNNAQDFARDDSSQNNGGQENRAATPSTFASHSGAVPLPNHNPANPAPPTDAQTNFFHATNAAAVETVIEAIESQVERLLPDGVSKNARNRVVGEIYRELDGTLRSNRQLAQQMRDAFRSGSLDAEHQRAIVSLIAGRARQALPGVAKRVLGEWTSTVVAASHDRRARQRAAERRVDIAGSSGGGNESHRPTSPRDIDYARMSDGDILNL